MAQPCVDVATPGWPESNYKSGSINWYFWSSECTTFRVTFAHLFRIQANKQCKADFLQIFRVIDCTNLVYVTAIRFCKISISIATTQWQIQICWQRQVLWSDSTWSYWNGITTWEEKQSFLQSRQEWQRFQGNCMHNFCIYWKYAIRYRSIPRGSMIL